MATIVVKNGEPLDKALKRFNKVSAVRRKEARRKEHFLSKKEKRRYKQEQNRSFR
ncbi:MULTISPECIES: 30S ribosomal protein S21 [Spiroplasma]|uniref:Small ribosomal subunit protein bS21 n=2 Tax=Spiroplasma TaxID=2132 RepID=W6AWZ0_9MOLU|nr:MULTISPECIES: 30S ribosomal protein S21 [Spiroplasma]AHF57937.1 30S ribosomal protein S21 [Spiroplasma eriocheiris CCTCC M 207170]AHI58244.1 30S ribosomal protein S21 [Spiroplasma mirum ATCC 29335]AKM53272.1 30S ribosomal protein S21 [Spiroplasma atrichopogonis]AKM54379.1 30S ribosomal protein S21 [Spiroplasma eriocheiris]